MHAIMFSFLDVFRSLVRGERGRAEVDAARRMEVNRWTLQEAEQRWPDFTSIAEEMGLRSYLSAGLGLAGRPLGALNLSSRETDGFDQLDERLMSLFTAPAAAAIVVARRYSEARKLAAQLEQAQIVGLIEQALMRLPARQREAFLLRYWEELDVAETAAAMGCSEGSVKTHCSRAVAALAGMLKAKGISL